MMAESIVVNPSRRIGDTGRGFIIGFAIGMFTGVLVTVLYVVSKLYGD
jgi:uncharacterized membrane protein (Fun14 family)